jgi:hypothetical protein
MPRASDAVSFPEVDAEMLGDYLDCVRELRRDAQPEPYEYLEDERR